jgi:uncharacterized protein YqeY
MSLKEQIDADLKTSMKSGDKGRTATIRSLKSAIKYEEIAAGSDLDDAGVLSVLAKQAKQRRDSITEFEKAGRNDLIEQERAELIILEAYLPAQLSEADIRQKAQAVISELGVTNLKGMGQVMQALMPQLTGVADGKIVSQVVRQLLAS